MVGLELVPHGVYINEMRYKSCWCITTASSSWWCVQLCLQPAPQHVRISHLCQLPDLTALQYTEAVEKISVKAIVHSTEHHCLPTAQCAVCKPSHCQPRVTIKEPRWWCSQHLSSARVARVRWDASAVVRLMVP
jgi:hypothetical protein